MMGTRSRFVRGLPIVALYLLSMVVPACSSHSETVAPMDSADASQDGEASGCGLPSAPSRCESTTWPRLAITFGDTAAASFSYVLTADDGVTSTGNPCPQGYGESAQLHCDLGFYGDAAERTIDVKIGTASVTVALRPFNYCGDGIAQLVVTSSDAGGAAFAPVTYVNACGL